MNMKISLWLTNDHSPSKSTTHRNINLRASIAMVQHFILNINSSNNNINTTISTIGTSMDHINDDIETMKKFDKCLQVEIMSNNFEAVACQKFEMMKNLFS